MKPAVMAMVDQADAASEQAHDALGLAAEHFGGRVGEVWLSEAPSVREVLNRMRDALISSVDNRHPMLCGHLSHHAPSIGIWAAHSPGKIRCGPCADLATARIIGTPEDRRCDQCRRIGPIIHPMTVQLPAVVIELPATPLSIPAVLVQFGLCPECRGRDEIRARRPGD